MFTKHTTPRERKALLKVCQKQRRSRNYLAVDVYTVFFFELGTKVSSRVSKIIFREHLHCVREFSLEEKSLGKPLLQRGLDVYD